MKKTCLMILALIALFCFASCKDDGSAALCKSLGSHDLQYVIEEDVHWLKCQQEGCAYKTEAEAHSGGEATCFRPAQCEICKTAYGGVLSHSGGHATCTEAAKCEKCGAIYEEAHGHKYISIEDECSKYKECSVCKIQLIQESHHVLDDNGSTCTVCHKNLLKFSFVLNNDGRSYSVSGVEFCETPNLTIPTENDGLPVTALEDWAFSGLAIEKVLIPAGIKEIGEYAFSDCRSLKSCVISNSVEVIGRGAFCASTLETITIGSAVTMIGNDAFSFTLLKSIMIPSNVEIIDENAFSDCEQLEEVVIGDGVKRIEQRAFARCNKLKKVILPNTLEYMEADVFEDSPAIECNIYKGMKYLGSATNPYFALVGSAGATQLVPHTDTVFYMSEALLNCENIVSAEIGPNVKFIGYRALGGMDSLEEITVHSDNAWYYVVNNILFDKSENKPIQACKTSVIPSDGSIALLEMDIFSFIASINTIYIPNSIKVVDFYFQGLNGLELLIIESDVEHLIIRGDYDGCERVTENCFKVYHCHTEAQWENVEVEYTFDRNAFIRQADCYGDTATHYFYSETEPTGEGNYWHYVDGVPTPWEDSMSSETNVI